MSFESLGRSHFKFKRPSLTFCVAGSQISLCKRKLKTESFRNWHHPCTKSQPRKNPCILQTEAVRWILRPQMVHLQHSFCRPSLITPNGCQILKSFLAVRRIRHLGKGVKPVAHSTGYNRSNSINFTKKNSFYSVSSSFIDLLYWRTQYIIISIHFSFQDLQLEAVTCCVLILMEMDHYL